VKPTHAKRPRTSLDAEIVPTTTKKPRGKGKMENKENQLDGEVDVDDEILNSRQWSVDDRTKLFTWLLGPEANDTFEKIKKSPTYVFKKVCF
jgi:hypothetical protein